MMYSLGFFETMFHIALNTSNGFNSDASAIGWGEMCVSPHLAMGFLSGLPLGPLPQGVMVTVLLLVLVVEATLYFVKYLVASLVSITT